MYRVKLKRHITAWDHANSEGVYVHRVLYKVCSRYESWETSDQRNNNMKYTTVDLFMRVGLFSYLLAQAEYVIFVSNAALRALKTAERTVIQKS